MTDSLSSPNTKSGRLQRACLELLRQHEREGAIPTNGRFIYYELVQAQVIPKAYFKADGSKAPRQPKDDIAAALTVLRQEGLVPWCWIEDETRHVHDWNYAHSVSKYLIDTVQVARIDLWAGQSSPFVICESRATMGVLRDLCARYLVPITATNGQCGDFLRTDIAPHLVPVYGPSRCVLYVGDLELRGPGEQIEENTRRVLAQAAGRNFEDEWERVALTQEQVDSDPRLSALVITKSDNRYKPPKQYEAVECEALGQTVLVEILHAHLDALLPEPIEEVLKREAQQRRRMVETLQGGAR